MCFDKIKDMYNCVSECLENNNGVFESHSEDFVPDRTSWEDVANLASAFYSELCSVRTSLKDILDSQNNRVIK
jgi:hypothetical protein